MHEDRFLFYQALTLYRKQLYLLSPQHDGDVELVHSAFIDELQRIAEIKTSTDHDKTLFSTENFLKNYGAFVWERSETEDVEKPNIPSMMFGNTSFDCAQRPCGKESYRPGRKERYCQA